AVPPPATLMELVKGARGWKKSRPPAETPTTRMMAQSANNKPSDLLTRRPTPVPEGRASNAPSITALQTARKAQPSIISHVGTTEFAISHAVASSSMPNKRLMPFIQAPALGNKAPDEAPTANSSKPSPQAIANNAVPPSTRSPVCEMNNSTPASGAATQGPTISADTMPMTNTPPYRPPGILDKRAFKAVCMPVGACSVKTSNMAKANIPSTIAKTVSTQGVCSQTA